MATRRTSDGARFGASAEGVAAIPARVPRRGRVTGHSSQRGARGTQTVAPSSMSA